MKQTLKNVFLLLMLAPNVILAQTMSGDTDRRLTDFAKSYEVVVAYRVLVPGQDRPFSLFARSKDSIVAFSWDGSSDPVRRNDISADKLELAWKTFVQNDLFTIADEKDVPNFCAEKYKIQTSHAYEFRLASEGTVRRLTYYDPEYYDVACYGMEERTKIINSAAVISFLGSSAR